MKTWVAVRVAMSIVIAVGIFTLNLLGYIILVASCFLGLVIGNLIEGRKVNNDQDSGDRLS